VFLRITLVIISLSIAACSAPVRKPQEQAVFQALVEDVTFRKLAEYCNKVRKTSEQDVWRAQKEWWQRNGIFVEAADYSFAYNLIDLTGERQETGARYAMGLSYDIVHEADTRSKKSIKEGLSKEGCTQVMIDYRDGKMDLSENKDMYALLLKLVQEKKTKGEDLLLKQAKLESKKGKAFSRSSITAQRLAKRSICPGAKVQTLKSKWPLEIFEASCPDDSFMLIECEWGNCKTR